MGKIHPDNEQKKQPVPRPYSGQQEPEFSEGGGFGKHEDEPRFGKFGGQVGGRGPVDPAVPEVDQVAGGHAQPQKNFAQVSSDGKYEGGESTGGYADHRDKPA